MCTRGLRPGITAESLLFSLVVPEREIIRERGFVALPHDVADATRKYFLLADPALTRRAHCIPPLCGCCFRRWDFLLYRAILYKFL